MTQTNEDTQLIDDLKNGDYAAFGKLYDKYSGMLYAFALNLSKNKYVAEEIVQEVFVKIWESKEIIHPEQSFKGFLFKIAQNRFYDILRKKVSEACYSEYLRFKETISTDDDTELRIENEETKKIILILLEDLPERRREIFKLSKFENMSYKQIAERLNISENTVDTQIRHALNYLRSELPKYLVLFFMFFLS